MTEPTDTEILDAADDFRSQYMHGGITFDEFDSIGFARAVLAKWGAPQAGVGAACQHEWDGFVRTSMPPKYACRKCHAFFDSPPTTTQQPTQAQAGAVPVGFRLVPIEPTVEILQAMDRAFSDAMHVGVPVSPEAYAAMIKAVDAADIKGADHGITAHGVADMKGGQDVE